MRNSNGWKIGAAVGVFGVRLGLLAGSAAAAAPLPQGSEPVQLDPAEFSVQIDNPYFPLVPGDRYIYKEVNDGATEKVRIGVSDETKQIANGVEARVVHDRVTEGGRVLEDTLDWYSQDREDNVWYLGEDTVECKRNGKIKNDSGSFEAGVDGAQAGVIMPADPQPGLAYRQEYYAGHAENKAKILSIDEQVQVAFGRFKSAVLTKDLVPLEPKVNEYKLFAPGIGNVLSLKTSGGEGREELIKLSHDRKIEIPKQSGRCVA